MNNWGIPNVSFGQTGLTHSDKDKLLCIFTVFLGFFSYNYHHQVHLHDSYFSELTKFPDFSSIFSHFPSIFLMICCFLN